MEENKQNFTQEDASQNKAMGILAYFGILVLIPILAAPNSKFARFHANQGLVLFLFEIAYQIVLRVVTAVVGSILALPLNLISIAFLVFAILGIIAAANGEEKELPIIGSIKLLK